MNDFVVESFDIFFRQLAPIAADMRRGLDQFIEKLSEKHPDLVSEKWGFSVNSNDSLVVTGNLSAQDQKVLTSLLNKDDGLRLLASNFSKLILKGMDLDRGPSNGSQGLGKFNLTEDNFSEIIDLRSYLDSPFTEKNAQGYQNVTDKNNIDDLYRTQGNIELGHQLASRAEVKYNKGTVDKYDFNTGEWNRVFGE